MGEKKPKPKYTLRGGWLTRLIGGKVYKECEAEVNALPEHDEIGDSERTKFYKRIYLASVNLNISTTVYSRILAGLTITILILTGVLIKQGCGKL